jgi:DNA-binding NarL/FixJ family response regulator
MDYKILIVSDESIEFENLFNFLKENFAVDILKSFDIENGLKVARDSLPHLIILDLDLPKMKGFQFLEILEADVITKDIPIAIISDLDNTINKSNLILYDIRGFFKRDFDKAQLVKMVKETLSKESKFSGSYTNRFIKSFISFNSSQSIASKMMAIVDAISYKIQIPTQKKMDIKSALAILSTTIKTNNLAKVLKLYKDMHFANDILHLLENFQKPRDIYEEIIYIIYKLKFNKYNKITNEGFENIDKDMLFLIKKIISENLISVRSGLDFEMVWERLTDVLMNETHIDFELADYFIHYVKEILVKLMSKTHSYDVKIINEEIKLKCIVDIGNIKIDDITEVSKYKEITLSFIDDDNSLMITINKISKPKVNSFTQKEQTLLGGENFVIMNSDEYLNSIGIDYSEDLEIMFDLEKDLDTNLIFVENNNYSIDDFEDVADLIFSYAERIDNTFYEFEAIGYALKDLAEVLFNITNNELNNDELKKIHIFLWQLKEDITKWRNNVFIDKSVENIHYLDASLLSSCMQIKSLITREEINTQDDDDIFF